jgi:hypothetical protein
LEINWAWNVAGIGRRGMWNPEGRRSLERSRRRWECNIAMDLTDIEWNAMNWIDPAQDKDQWRALVTTVMSLGIR